MFWTLFYITRADEVEDWREENDSLRETLLLPCTSVRSLSYEPFVKETSNLWNDGSA